MSWLHGARARLRLLFGRGSADSRFNEEIRFHIDMETERLQRDEGLDGREARRRAMVAFGGVENVKEELREGRGLRWLSSLELDFRVGFRTLLKYPGLTIVGGLAMAFAIWAGTVSFEMVTMFARPTLPLPGGDRIVQLGTWDLEANKAEPRALYEFVLWRGALRSVTDIGAYRDVTHNLVIRSAGDGGTHSVDARPVEVAQITASAFHIDPSPPLLGRTLVAADEQPGAPAVMVIGHEIWRTRFASDSGVIGRSVQLADEFATIVGVMPGGFAFPEAHELWTPLRPSEIAHAPREGPAITIFARLAPGVGIDAVRAELATLGDRTSAEFPDTHRHLRPRAEAYAKGFFSPSGGDLVALASVYIFAIALLVLMCGNVALLLFARAATRERELVVRSALGATRGRIIVQLFAEALALGVVAAGVGLAAAQFALQRWGRGFLEINLGRLPFWYDFSISPLTMLYAFGLTVLGAAIAGVLPALKVTRGLESRLRAGSGGGGGPRFGGVWTAVIISQVAVTVAFPAVVFVEQRELNRIRSYDVGFAAEQYLSVKLERDADSVSAGAALEELRTRVMAEPSVAGVTFVDRLPRDFHPERIIEIDGDAGGTAANGPVRYPGEVSLARIDPSYFTVLESPILAGRAFQIADLAPDARVAIVDQGFVDEVLGGRNAIGRRLRFASGPQRFVELDQPGPWHEIVGVVKDLGMGYVTHRHRAAGLYLPVRPEHAVPLRMVVHVRGDPLALAPRVHTIAGSVDPTMQLSEIQRVSEVTNGVQWVLSLWLRITLVLTGVALLLSLAGIYAVLSFTVARRTREIGVRVALGASPWRVVTAIFRRPLTQVALGVVAGGALIGAVAVVLADAAPSIGNVALLAAYAAFMMAVCLIACVVPTWRALRVQPMEALRAE